MIPPKEIPKELYEDFTMQNKIGVQYQYFDGRLTATNPKIYEEQKINNFLTKVAKKETSYYGINDTWLYQALEKYHLKNKRVAIIGSTTPWYESICLYYGAKVTTIEYNKIISKHPLLRIITPLEYDNNPIKFDAALSISSFEHDGLGRYGDPINPNGDIEAMKRMKTILNQDGILFLSVPVAKDTLVWNAHRVYGKVRLPLLLDGWLILDAFGYHDKLLDMINFVQPIFVLKNSL